MNRLGTILVAAAAVAAFSGALLAAGGGAARVRSTSKSLPPSASIPRKLAKLPKLPAKMTHRKQGIEAVSVLSYDDNTCEGGLGANTTVSDLVEFDPAPPCTNAGPLQILDVTARMDTFTANSFVFFNPGPTPGMANAPDQSQVLSSPITGVGACPATGGAVQRVLSPAISFSPGNATNFYAGIKNNGFAGRDSSSAPAGRIWLLCAACGMTQYSPTALTGFGLGGNWMIRVTVEDAGCSPVELQHFEVTD
jgi:hypothetical protein